MKSQFVTSRCIGMTKEMEKIEGKANEPVANCDQLPKAIDIQPMIRVIRGQQVIIDRDLALLYGVETKRLNEQVKRNIERFPDDFMFQLNKEEVEILKSQMRPQVGVATEGCLMLSLNKVLLCLVPS